MSPHLNEKSRRLFAAIEASAIGYGGVSIVARATQISRRAIHVGLNEITNNEMSSNIRSPGGCRIPAVIKNPEEDKANKAHISATSEVSSTSLELISSLFFALIK